MKFNCDTCKKDFEDDYEHMFAMISLHTEIMCPDCFKQFGEQLKAKCKPLEKYIGKSTNESDPHTSNQKLPDGQHPS